MQPLKERIVTDLTFEEVMRSIDVYGRLAYGGQCVATMAMLAAPVLFVTACIAPFILWDDSRLEAVLAWLGGWLVALATGAGGFLFGALCWRWSGDWITEWPGYAVAVVIAGAANVALAYLLTSTPSPVYISFLGTMASAFAIGCLVAGHLAGTQVLAETRQARRAVPRRR